VRGCTMLGKVGLWVKLSVWPIAVRGNVLFQDLFTLDVLDDLAIAGSMPQRRRHRWSGRRSSAIACRAGIVAIEVLEEIDAQKLGRWTRAECLSTSCGIGMCLALRYITATAQRNDGAKQHRSLRG
jgi:hypothetical protein